ncbi:MAG: YfhO family protein [Verrucomicrobia bacterium]|nr:YfhO family protein [Verrucomicrobiota bacterium]MCG2678965.1 YfhO family protein [Kiritimatiellia bacterium]MBU4247621.1 YfhO family protein [Verrucomicrobiota bacterium]MBU4290802.1 YfhO family protein [Verrucomicrobiota bacterium]MBU4428348.1 YfhO family protein [Verrucomicrobiota bacterium]
MKKQKQPEPSTKKSAPAFDTLVTTIPRWVRHFVTGVFILGGLLALWALMQTGAVREETALMNSQGWGSYAAIIVGNKVTALWHAALMTLAAGVCLWILTSPLRRASMWRRAPAWILVLIVAGDALWLSRHYIKTMPMSVFEENDVIRILKSDMPEHRVALVSQDGFYNFWLTYVFPYYHILTMNVTQMPRMPADYKRYLEAVGGHALRYWQLSAVGYVLAPSQVWGQIQNDPAMKDAFDLVYAYNVTPAEMGVKVIPATPSTPGQHAILRLKKPAPRFALIAGWQEVGDDEALRRLGARDFVPFEKVLVAPESVAGLPATDGRGIVGQVQLIEYKPGYMKLKVSSDGPSILRVSEKYDRDWHAWIDGEPVPVRRVDFICQGILVPSPGLHEVMLKYAPDKRQLIWQWLGIMICLGAGIALIVKSQSRKSDAPI